MSIILAFQRLRQEKAYLNYISIFQARLGYKGRTCPKQNQAKHFTRS